MARIDTDLLGLQIIALDSATVVGEVDGLLIDDAGMKVAGFLVDTGLYEASTLPFESAYAVGSDAVIVESADRITEISANPTLEALAEKDVAISEAKGITRSGRGVGIIGDFFVDTQTGDVVGMEFIAADQTVYPRDTAVIPASAVLRLGRDMVVLQDDYDKHLMKDEASLERFAQPRPLEATPAAVVAAEAVTTDQETHAEPAQERKHEVHAAGPESVFEAPANEGAPAEDAVEETPSESAVEAESGVASGEVEPQSTEPELTAVEVGPFVTAASLAPSEDDFTSQQKHFLIGKRVLRRIESPAGEVIADEGDLVTFEMIEMAKRCDQLLILSLNVE